MRQGKVTKFQRPVGSASFLLRPTVCSDTIVDVMWLKCFESVFVGYFGEDEQ